MYRRLTPRGRAVMSFLGGTCVLSLGLFGIIRGCSSSASRQSYASTPRETPWTPPTSSTNSSPAIPSPPHERPVQRAPSPPATRPRPTDGIGTENIFERSRGSITYIPLLKTPSTQSTPAVAHPVQVVARKVKPVQTHARVTAGRTVGSRTTHGARVGGATVKGKTVGGTRSTGDDRAQTGSAR